MTDSNREIVEVDLGISGLKSPLTIERNDIVADGIINGIYLSFLLDEILVHDHEHPGDEKVDWKICPEVVKHGTHYLTFKMDKSRYRLLILLEKEIEDRYPEQDDEDSEVGQ